MRFDPRPRTGGDPMPSIRGDLSASFDPRPRTGGDPAARTGPAFQQSFDPRPRTGGDAAPLNTLWLLRVSIHAPARGATHGAYASSDILMFRSTPPHGGRPPIAIVLFGRGKGRPKCEVWIDVVSLSSAVRTPFSFLQQCQRAGAGANRPHFAVTLGVRAPARHLLRGPCHTMSGPPRSAAGLAPTCSTLRRQFAPR